MNISIVYEDQDLLIINKPSGLLTHPVNRKDKSESVVDWAIKRYPQIKDIQDKQGAAFGEWVDLRPGIVHRLDKETSGLMIIAKTQTAFNYLKEQFRERNIKKQYLALVVGKLENKSGRIELPLGKIGAKQSTVIHGKKNLKEKRAMTEYRVIQYFRDYSLLEVSPVTGRTHQIRIHLKSIGHPVVCDSIYGGKPPVCPPDLRRLFLHSHKLLFTTPSGNALALEADLPSELSKFLVSLPKEKLYNKM